MIITQSYQSPVGELVLASYRDKLVLCDWKYRKMRNTIDQRIQKGLKETFKEGNSPTLEKTTLQLNEYFKGQRNSFDITLQLVGTDFQQKVWQTLQAIPFGSTQSYLELSRTLGNEKAIRAVASANGANAISIIVPCHRVIGSNKELTGYAGGLTAKKKLLTLENPTVFQEQLDLFE